MSECKGRLPLFVDACLLLGSAVHLPPIFQNVLLNSAFCAGLGCPASAYVVCAGVGTIGLVDGDAVERSNLHRQILHAPCRIGVPKVTSAALALKALAPSCNILEHNEFLTSANARALVRLYDCVLDCTDNAGV